MAQPRHLTRAPITEALVDLRAIPTKPLVEQRQALHAELVGRFAKVIEIRGFETEVRIEAGQEPVSYGRNKGVQGLRFESATGEEIAQFRLDGFTYNRLKPYTSGTSVLGAALDLWGVYLRYASPELVSRVALRYINHLQLQAKGLENLGAFLASPPVPPVGSPALLQSHWMRSVSVVGDSATSVIFTQAVEKGVQADTIGVILDIDASRLGSFNTDPDSLRPMLESLRTLKNDVFFGSISEATVEVYA